MPRQSTYQRYVSRWTTFWNSKCHDTLVRGCCQLFGQGACAQRIQLTSKETMHPLIKKYFLDESIFYSLWWTLKEQGQQLRYYNITMFEELLTKYRVKHKVS